MIFAGFHCQKGYRYRHAGHSIFDNGCHLTDRRGLRWQPPPGFPASRDGGSTGRRPGPCMSNRFPELCCKNQPCLILLLVSCLYPSLVNHEKWWNCFSYKHIILIKKRNFCTFKKPLFVNIARAVIFRKLLIHLISNIIFANSPLYIHPVWMIFKKYRSRLYKQLHYRLKWT